MEKDEKIIDNFKYYCSDNSVCCESETTEQCLNCFLTYIRTHYILEEKELE